MVAATRSPRPTQRKRLAVSSVGGPVASSVAASMLLLGCSALTSEREEYPETPECAGHCDCPGAESCVGGSCTQGTSPGWCCEGPECPSGAFCMHEDGRAGIPEKPAIGICVAGGGGGGAPECAVSLTRVLRTAGFDVLDMVLVRRQNRGHKLAVLRTTGTWLVETVGRGG